MESESDVSVNSYLRTRLFVEETHCLLNRMLVVTRSYQVSFSTVFFFVSCMHIHVPFIMYCSRLFVVVFQEMNCLNLTLFVRSLNFIFLQGFHAIHCYGS